MITAITQFPLPSGVDIDAFRQELVTIAPEFTKPAGLLSKAFVISEDRGQGGGVYLWRSQNHALAFEPVIRSMIRQKLGVEASIRYFETPVVVDNQRQTIEVA
jgi:hypothetical protein